jgi:hypothetical protein
MTAPAARTPAAAAVVDLLGVLAYGELSGMQQLAEDAARTPELSDAVRIADLAAAELRHFDLLRVRLAEQGVDVAEAMEPFRTPIDEFHARTTPADWVEGVVKAYVGNGIGVDFYREVAALVDDRTRALVLDVLDDTGHADFAVERVRRAIEEDPRIAGRLALWGRRIVGEALAQAQHVVAEREPLADLLMGAAAEPDATTDAAEVQRLFLRIAEHHSRRMAALGLSA